jgi:hypothetical protein
MVALGERLPPLKSRKLSGSRCDAAAAQDVQVNRGLPWSSADRDPGNRSMLDAVIEKIGFHF